MASAPASAGAAARVAVIVPACGVAHLVGEALASLQAQTFAAWECVVVGDGAPDDVRIFPHAAPVMLRWQQQNHVRARSVEAVQALGTPRQASA